MEQIWTKRTEPAKDLGTLTPDAKEGQALYTRMLEAREASRKAEALAAYTSDQEALANHDVMGYINAAAGDIEHMAEKNPQIAERYEKVLAVLEQRRGAIATGSRARRPHS